MSPPPEKVLELGQEQLEQLLLRLDRNELESDDYATLRAALTSYHFLTRLLDDKNTTLARLRKILFGASTEKTANVLGRASSPPDAATATPPVSADSEPAPASAPPQSRPGTTKATKKKGHGRNGADDFPGARRIPVPHATLQTGASCPECLRGTVYTVSNPGILLRFHGVAPIQATVYELQKLRCNLCGQVFTAESPAGVGSDKYEATAVAMVGLLKYGTGMPFHRLDRLQEQVEIPLPASTQWDLVSGGAEQLQPIHNALIQTAAQGEVLYNDDTTITILERMAETARQAALDDEASDRSADSEVTDEKSAKKPRTGTFTSGVVATRDERRIALFFSGHQDAGENLRDVLSRRAAELPPPIQMSDALSRNRPGELQTIVASCLAHARRQFVEQHDKFPEPCQYVLEVFEVVYKNDETARTNDLTPEERLRWHQAESGPPLERLRAWLKQQIDDRLVEPNSALGGAIDYLRKHWDKLTLFLRVAGAPLDSNLVERALKKAILHRKNAYFYRTQHGASVGDLYMSLIYTCELNGVNPFAYLTAVLRHGPAVAAAPERWLPWNYLEAMPDEPPASTC